MPNCSICQSTCDRDRHQYALACSHQFHLICLIDYLANTTDPVERCANCRRSISESDKISIQLTARLYVAEEARRAVDERGPDSWRS